MKPNCSLIIDGFSLEVAISKQKKYTLHTFPFQQLVHSIDRTNKNGRIIHKHFVHCFPKKNTPKMDILRENLNNIGIQTYSAMKVFGASNTQPSLIKSQIVGSASIIATILSIELLDHKHDTVFILTSDIAVASSIYILNRKKLEDQEIVTVDYSCLSRVPALEKVCDRQVKVNLPM